MGLIDRVTAWWRRARGENEGTAGRSTGDEVRRPARPSTLLNRFDAERDRRASILDCRAMYDEDTRAEGSISTLARDAIRGGFRIKVDDARAQEVADALVQRLGLMGRLDDWIRLTLRDGDSFLEVSVDEGRQIVDVTRKPTLEMHRNSDESDRFVDATRAYWWADRMWADQAWGTDAAPEDATWFAEWQIVHARWHHDEGSRYGRPQFASGRKPYKRMVEGEYDIAVRRKTRAGMKYLHVLEGASDPDIEAYKETNKDALDNPFAAVADFFTNKAGAISVIQGDARLGEIGDVEHHIDTWWVASPVPKSLLGYGRNINRDVLKEQKAQYDETLPEVTRWVEAQIVRPLLELQWLLAGIWPGGLSYEVVWASKRMVTPGDIRDLADAVARLRVTGLLTDGMLLGIMAGVLPNIDIDEALAALKQREMERQADEDRFAQASEEARLTYRAQAAGD